jgi:hypothetical protein
VLLPRPLALGIAGACAGFDASATIRLVAHDDVANVTAACLRLGAGEPGGAVTWIHRSFEWVELLAARLAGVREVADMPRLDRVPA